MTIIYHPEHTSYSDYAPNEHICFKYIKVEQGASLDIDDMSDKHIFFFLEGSIKMRYNEFPDTVFSAGEMIFLPKSADYRGEALTRCAFIVLVYDNQVKIYDNATFESIQQHAKRVSYEFKSLPIIEQMRYFLDLLRLYLLDGVNFRYMHEIKEAELFLLLGVYYQSEKLAQFFLPMIGKSMDFRSKVMTNYLKARTAKELACTCLYSERQFYALFVKEFGESPYQWMQKQKAKHIIGRLYEENVPIKEIINEFNFSSQSHFNRYCNRLWGQSPLMIRQKIRTLR